MKSKFIICLLVAVSYTSLYANGNAFFGFENHKSRQRVPFELINNLVVINLNVNGQKLRFLLDSGVNTTLLFNNNQITSVDTINAKTLVLRGLGQGEPVTAYLATGNTIRLKNLVARNQNILMIDETEFEFARRMGTQVDGVIGYSLLSSGLVTINYSSGYLVFSNFDRIRSNFCKKCYRIPLEFHQNKPYISTSGLSTSEEPFSGKFLVDSGSGDSIWLFEGRRDVDIVDQTFDDFLGRAINGNIFGKRGKIHSLNIGERTIDGVKVAYPELGSLQNLELIPDRIGSIGGEILRRFQVSFDYQNRILYLKPTRQTNRPFYYNMAGIEIQHNGVELIRKRITNNMGVNIENDDSTAGVEVFLQPQFRLELRPVIEIFNVRAGSPADIAGIKTGDILKKINGQDVSKIKIYNILSMLQKRPGQRLRIVVERRNRPLKFTLTLKKLFD